MEAGARIGDIELGSAILELGSENIGARLRRYWNWDQGILDPGIQGDIGLRIRTYGS